MKRIVEVSSPTIRVRAIIKTNGKLSRDETEGLCADLADRLMLVLRDVRYEGYCLSSLKVKA